MKTARIALTLLAAGFGFHAAAQAEEAAADVKTAGFKLKNRSSFSQAEDARAPFWPIGWKKPAPGEVQVTAVETPKFTLDPDQFSVTSILLGSPSIAVINGKPYAQGEYIRAPKASAKASAQPTASAALPLGTKVRVAHIRDGRVTLDFNGQLTELTLRRAEVSVRHIEEEGSDLLKPLSER